jgi:hypothetical protein
MMTTPDYAESVHRWGAAQLQRGRRFACGPDMRMLTMLAARQSPS